MYKIIGVDQKEYGPVSADQIRQWISEGRVNGQTRVQAAGAMEWKSLSDVPELAATLPATFAPIAPTLPPLTPAPRTSQAAIWSLVTGALSFLCCFCCVCWILGPTAIVLGLIALSHMKAHPELTGRGLAIAGIILGTVAILASVVLTITMFNNPQFMQNFHNSFPQ